MKKNTIGLKIALVQMVVLTGTLFAQSTDLLSGNAIQTQMDSILYTVYILIRGLSVGLIVVLLLNKVAKALIGHGQGDWYSCIYMAIGAIAIWNAGSLFEKITGIDIGWIS